MAVPHVAAEPQAPSIPASQSRNGRLFTGVGVTAGAAIIAGLLLVTRDQSVGTLGILAIAVGAVALLTAAAAAREWRWARQWTGPNGMLEPIAGPMAWLAVIFAAVVVTSRFVPVIVPAWSQEQVFAVAIVAFVILSVLGWGPGVAISWPSGLRLSSLTVLGSLVAVLLVGAYLVFLVLLRADAATATDQVWARLVEIRSTLEALAFAAAGALLGTVVQRQAHAGERTALQRDRSEKARALGEAQAALASTQAKEDALRVALTDALRDLTPGAPADLDLERLESAAAVARPNATTVRQARRRLLEALKGA